MSSDKSGNRRIIWSEPDGRRVAIYLGKMSKADAGKIKVRIEHLVSAKLGNLTIDGETSQWLAGISDKLFGKLAKAGLVQPRKKAESVALGAYLDDIIKHADVKPGTRQNLECVTKKLVDFFGVNCDITTIDADAAERFRRTLTQSPVTTRRLISSCRQLFRPAVRRKWILENPFADIKGKAGPGSDRKHFISMTDYHRLIDAAPNQDWRTMIALSRIGGMRFPSEALSIKWSDVIWDANRMIVPSPKTEHQGKAKRVIPIFPELRVELDAAWALLGDEPADYVVPEKYRRASFNNGRWSNPLADGLVAIALKAGLKPWPKIWHNMRASRETELLERFPLQVVTGWIGNTPAVALKHYLQTTDEHFDKAINPDDPTQNPTRSTAPPEFANVKTTDDKDQKPPIDTGKGVNLGQDLTSANQYLDSLPGLRDGRKKPEETGNSESGVSQNDARAGIALWQAAAISAVKDHKAAWARLGTNPSDRPDDLADAMLVGFRAAIDEAKGLFPAVASVLDPLYQLAGQWIGLTDDARRRIAEIADADDTDAGADLPPADSSNARTLKRVGAVLAGPHAEIFLRWLKLCEPHPTKSVATVSGILAMTLEMVRQELTDPKPTMADVGARGLAMIETKKAEHPDLPIGEIVLRHCCEMSAKLTDAVIQAAKNKYGWPAAESAVKFIDVASHFDDLPAFAQWVVGAITRHVGEYGIYRALGYGIVEASENRQDDDGDTENPRLMFKDGIATLTMIATIFAKEMPAPIRSEFVAVRDAIFRFMDADADQRQAALDALPWVDLTEDDDDEPASDADADGPEFDAGHGWEDRDDTDDDYSTQDDEE